MKARPSSVEGRAFARSRDQVDWQKISVLETLAIPEPVTVTDVPVGSGSLALAFRRNPGPRTPSVPQVPERVNAPTSPLEAAADGVAATAALR